MPTYFNAELYGGKRGLAPPMDVIIREKVGQHQVVVAGFQDWLSPSSLPEGTPISMKWGDRRGMRMFNGYVSYIKPNHGRMARTNVTCVGSTSVLKGGNQRSWQATTTKLAFKQVTARWGLLSDVDDDGRVSPIQQPGGITEWQFLNRLADKSGLLLVSADGGIVKALDPYKRAAEARAATIYAPNSAHHIYEAEAVLGSQSPRGGRSAQRRGLGVTDKGQVFGAQSTSLMNELQQEVSTHVTRSRVELTKDIERDHARSQLAYEAKVRVNGAPGAVPGSFIGIQGMGESFDGYWVVHETHHSLRDTFVSNLTLRRFTPAGWSARYVRPQVRGRTPTARLVKGQWRAR
jgi:hypothetical protein